MAFPFKSTGLFGRPSGRPPSSPHPRHRRALPRWLWRSSPKAARPNAAAGYERLIFDPLEPRLLLNADVLTVNLAQQGAAAPVDHSLIVQMVQATEQVNNQAVTVQRVQVVDQANNAILAFGDLNEISGLSIDAGNGNNTITIDATSFAGQQAPAISIDGGSGQNNLVFDNSTNNTSWQLTGQNSGSVSGAGVNVAFQNVQNLTSGTANANTLTVEQSGTLSGVFDGGAGQNNSLLLNTWEHQSAEASIGPQYDTITLDGQAYNYTDVQNVNIGDPTEMEFNATLGGTVTGATITMEANSGGGFNFISSSYNSGDNSLKRWT